MTAVDFAAFVDRLAQVSGEVILPFFRTAIGAEDKSRGGVFDPVTEADRGAEAAMRRLIAQMFPAHGVIGEEYGQDRPDAEYVWVLDPIDGTKSFISGLPTWGTLIGLMHRGKPVYGMMAQPFTRERYFGDGNAFAPALPRPGARRRAERRMGRPGALRARACASLAEATVMTTSPALIGDEGDRAAYRRVEEQSAARALWRRLLRLLRVGGRLRRSRDRDRPEAARRRRAGADRHWRRRVMTTWDGEGRRQGRPHHRRRRPARLRRGARDCSLG